MNDMSNNKKAVWIVTTNSTDENDFDVKLVKGTKDELKEYLTDLVKIYKKKVKEWNHWRHGTTSPDEIKEEKNGCTLTAYGQFDDSYIVFSAVLQSSMKVFEIPEEK